MRLETVTELRDDSVVLRVRGEVDLASADEFAGALDTALSKGLPTFVDLGGVGFIDSTGLHALIRAGRSTNGHGALTVVEASAHVMRLLAVVGARDLPWLEVRPADG